MAISTLPRSVNGRATKALDILRLGDTVEEKRPVEINGRQLWAWVTLNGRYPSSVAAELDDARNRWMATRVPIDPELQTPQQVWARALDIAELLDAVEGEQSVDVAILQEQAKALRDAVRGLQENPEMRSSEVDWQAYLTEALCVLIPGLDYHEADLMLPDARLVALYELGYMRPPEAESEVKDESEGGTSQAPPEQGPSSTGDEPAPTSVASTE